MKSISLAPAIRLSLGVNIFQLAAYLKGNELFGEAELVGTPGAEKLITMEAVIQGNDWYESYVHPVIYEGYPLLGWMKVGRADPYTLGIPPVRDIFIENIKQNITLQSSGSNSNLPFTNEYLAYNLGESVASDFRDMQRHAVNYVADDPSRITPRLETLVTQPLPYIRHGPYRIKMTYTIPGINKETSSYEVEIFNRIPDND